MFKNWHFTFTSATIVSIIAAAIAVAVAFGLDLSQAKIDSLMTLVGLIAAALTVGGGAVTAAAIRTGALSPKSSGTFLHLTPATLVAIIGAVVTCAVTFGLKLSSTEIAAIMKLVGLIAGSVVVGGAFKSHAMVLAGVHPKYPSAHKAGVGTGI